MTVAEQLAREINARFDEHLARQKSVGVAAEVVTAEAAVFAAYAFFEQTVGRRAALMLIGELLDA